MRWPNSIRKRPRRAAKKKKRITAEDAKNENAEYAKESKQKDLASSADIPPTVSQKVKNKSKPSASTASSGVQASSGGPIKRPMPTTIHPMLAESVAEPFDGAQWLFEIKWDGYRAIAFIENGKVRLVSRNQNDLTARYPELNDMAQLIKAKTAILDGEVVALDEEGKASFSLMQQRTGFRPGGRR